MEVARPEEATTETLRTAHEQWTTHYSAQLEKFLRTYGAPEGSSADGGGDRKNASVYEYMTLDAMEIGVKSIFVDLQEIRSWPGEEGDDLADFLQHYYLDLSIDVDDLVERFVKDTISKYSVGDSNAARERERFNACFFNASSVHSVRSLRCDSIGRLVNLRATVTRTSDIRPELRVASFECDTCGRMIEKVEQQFKYTEPSVCQDKLCGNRLKWNLKQETCEFSDWQKIRVQENAAEIPAGSMPRAIDIIVRNDVCDRCKAGDKVLLTGCLLAIPDVPSLMKPGQVPKTVTRDKTRHERSEFGMQDNAIRGLRNLGVRDLGYRLCFLGTHVKVVNSVTEVKGLDGARRRDEEEGGPFASLSNRDRDLFLQIAAAPNCLSRLARTVAPEVHGHEEIKKGLLMLMAGGVEKSTEKEEIKLRGDINACIVGDPGTGKSQLLKFVQEFVGRGVYTSGKSSTSAGLTASVNRDVDQGDAVIEAGALLLADKGVCCIDEFDKMDEKDMVAIHEAMEQQTISIAKAGIQATLNARASVLAACNPSGGRYDPSKTFRQNVRLSAPIMSRFDLFFVMVDDIDLDEVVARHMVKLHTAGAGILGLEGELPRAKLQEYLRIARCFRPKVTDEAREVLKAAWITLRQQDVMPGSTRNVRITVRQLESLIRLSEADAKLRFSEEVLPVHVEEAYRIYHDSLTKVKKGRIDLGEDEEEWDDDDEGADGGDDQGGPDGRRRRPRRLADETDEEYEERVAQTMEEWQIDVEEYERVAQVLVEHLREQEQMQGWADGGDAGVVTRDALVTWYLDTHFDTDSEEELTREYRRVVRVINRMANRDLTLIEETRPLEVRVGNEVDVQHALTVRLHPNYAGGQVYGSSAGGRAHASLDPTYYAAAGSDDLTGAMETTQQQASAKQTAGRRGRSSKNATPAADANSSQSGAVGMLNDDEFAKYLSDTWSDNEDDSAAPPL